MKLLIVDDEIAVIKRIQRQIDWNPLPIDEIRYVEDGMDALSLCEAFLPDILLSDIRMPRMDGITLATKLRRINPAMKLIFISGYAEIDYYKSAIRLNVVSFLEKPLDMKECFHALKSATDEIIESNQVRSEIQELADTIVQKTFFDLAILLSSPTVDLSKAKRLMEQCGIERFRTDCYVAIKIDFHEEPQQTIDALRSYLHIVSSVASLMEVTCCATERDKCLVCFLFYNVSPHPHCLNDFCNQLFVRFTEAHANFTIAVGRTSTNLEHIHKSYQEAIIASMAAFYHESGYISWYYNVTKQYPLDQLSPAGLVSSIQAVTREYFRFHFRALIFDIRKCEATPPQSVKQFLFSYAHALFQIAAKEEYVLWESAPSVYALSSYIMSREYLSEIEVFLLQGIDRYYSLRAEGTFGNKTVDYIVHYVRKNFSDPGLSTSSIGATLGLSDAYISRLFKSVTGDNLKSYITDCRMKKACELLLKPGSQVSDVALQTGFRNGNYFASKFKERFNCTPTEYKEHHAR